MKLMLQIAGGILLAILTIAIIGAAVQAEKERQAEDIWAAALKNMQQPGSGFNTGTPTVIRPPPQKLSAAPTPNSQAPATQPSAYRWKDAKGQWHISDRPPAPGIEAEIIPIIR